MTRLRWSAVALGALLASSCGDGGRVPGGVAVWDSAGVEIVELAGTVWTEAGSVEWPSMPVRSLGAVGGPDEEILFRVSGGALLSDGRIVVLSRGALELRFYGLDGRLQLRQGRGGDGPGEYRWPAGGWLLPPGTPWWCGIAGWAGPPWWVTMDG